MILKSIRLIPRYNWDYGLRQWALAVWKAIRPGTENLEFFENLLQRKAVFTNSGRASLFAILKSLNLARGTGIGVPLYCCPVVFDAIVQAGFKPVFIDINPDDFNVSPEDILKKKDTFEAIIIVHMFGKPADMDTILSTVGDIPVIEDCAQSLFSKYKNKLTGSLSTVSFFSFRSGKYISAGEGSFIFCRDESLRQSIQNIANGFEDWSTFQMILQNSSTYIKSKLYKRPFYGAVGYPIGKKLDQRFNLTAKTGFAVKKIARSNLSVINRRIVSFHQKVALQRANSKYLLKKISLDSVALPKLELDINFYQFALRFDNEQQRNYVADFMFKNGVDTAKYLDDVAETARQSYGYHSDCPVAEKSAKTALIIPNHYTLSKKDLDYIAKCINKSANNLPLE